MQAAVTDGFASTRLIAASARERNIATPMLDLASALFAECLDLDYRREDMSAVIAAIEARTDAATVPTLEEAVPERRRERG